MAKGYMTGMMGVYIAAAELSFLNFIASPTSRSAFGADLLVTDQSCQKAWTVQVKTNRKAASFWLVNKHVAEVHSESLVYIFVNLKGDLRPDYFAVPSKIVARIHKVQKAKTGNVFYAVHRKDMPEYSEAWTKVFGTSTPVAEAEAA